MGQKTILATIIMLLTLGAHAYGCKCNEPGTIKDSYGKAVIVVHGKVINRKIVSFAETIRSDKEKEIRDSLKTDKRKLELFELGFVVEITLRVIDKFKSNVSDTVIIYTTINGASCGYRFELEKEYIVYASDKSYSYDFFLTKFQRNGSIEKQNTFWTNHCTRTAEYNGRQADELKRLRKGER